LADVVFPQLLDLFHESFAGVVDITKKFLA
jgi:hypothetical protein